MSTPAFASAFALSEEALAAASACLERLVVPPEANLGFVYFSDRLSLHAEALVARLRAGTGIAHWVGSVAVGVCGRGAAAIDQGAVSVMVGRFPPESFHVFSGRQPLSGSSLHQPYFAVVHADPATPDMTDLIADMAGKVSSGFVTGGLSSSRARVVQIADGVVSGGISGVAFSPAVPVATRLTQGCAALPGRHLVTRAEGNIIVTLDSRPALDAFKAAAGPELAANLREAAARVLVGIPVSGSEADDYTVRNIVALDPQSGMIAIDEEVEAGASLLFCRRDPGAALEDMHRALASLKASLRAAPQAALYVSCLGRGGNTFEEDATEPKLIRAAFGDIPLAGFFANGEISRDHLYGYTGVLTLFL
ncbi:MAG: hypothetical protein AUK49_00485 [Betaproteobacteria bacterium CG2_30_68_42]|nr:MAG: hypothetical protein AUK49_00485 [Betaproteobacteria bacterium CG2_30_68_42]